MRGTVALGVGQVVVLGGEHLRGNGFTAREDKLIQVGVGVVVLFLLQHIVLVQRIHLQFQRCVLGSVVVAEVQAYLHRVASDAVGGALHAVIGEHEVELRERIVLKRMELCGKVSPDACAGLWVIYAAQIAARAVSQHGVHGLGMRVGQERTV